MDTALPQKFPFILDRNLAKANCTGNRVCTSCDIAVLDLYIIFITSPNEYGFKINFIDMCDIIIIKIRSYLVYCISIY